MIPKKVIIALRPTPDAVRACPNPFLFSAKTAARSKAGIHSAQRSCLPGGQNPTQYGNSEQYIQKVTKRKSSGFMLFPICLVARKAPAIHRIYTGAKKKTTILWSSRYPRADWTMPENPGGKKEERPVRASGNAPL